MASICTKTAQQLQAKCVLAWEGLETAALAHQDSGVVAFVLWVWPRQHNWEKHLNSKTLHKAWLVWGVGKGVEAVGGYFLRHTVHANRNRVLCKEETNGLDTAISPLCPQDRNMFLRQNATYTRNTQDHAVPIKMRRVLIPSPMVFKVCETA